MTILHQWLTIFNFMITFLFYHNFISGWPLSSGRYPRSGCQLLCPELFKINIRIKYYDDDSDDWQKSYLPTSPNYAFKGFFGVKILPSCRISCWWWRLRITSSSFFRTFLYLWKCSQSTYSCLGWIWVQMPKLSGTIKLHIWITNTSNTLELAQCKHSVSKGSLQNKFSVKVGNLAQPPWPPPPPPSVGIPKKEKKNCVYFAF